MSESFEPAYWAVIPAPVRYDTTIPANAKLLYAEITSLAKRPGYCYASNAYFADLYEITATSVRRLLKALSDRGYITVEVIRDDKTHEVVSRRIFVGVHVQEDGLPSAQFCAEGSRQKSAEGSAQKSAEASAQKSSPIIRNNSKNLNNPPIIPRGGKRAEKKPVCAWNEARFLAFWDFYRTKFCAVDSSRAGERAAAAAAWDKLKPSDEEIDQLAAKLTAIMRTQQWRDGIGIKYASTILNGVRRGTISLDELPDAAPMPRSAPDEGRRYVRTDIVDGQEVDVYE